MQAPPMETMVSFQANSIQTYGMHGMINYNTDSLSTFKINPLLSEMQNNFSLFKDIGPGSNRSGPRTI